MPSEVRIRFFASARERVGRSTLAWPVPPAGTSVRALLRAVVLRYPSLGPIVAHCRFVRNSEYVRDLSERIRPGDDLGIHPPYSGG